MKYHSIAAGVLVAVFVATPVFASADATTDLQTQLIAVLEQLIQTLTAEIALLEQHTYTPPVAAPVSCPSYSLPACANGTLVPQGTDVNGCQLSPRCVPTTSTISFTASPTAGVGPLAVRFSWNAAAVGINDSMDFGDGQHGNWLDGIPSGMSHTYVSAGTYTARLNGPSGTTTGSITVTVAQNAPPCLLYQIPNCAAGQHVQSGPSDSNGCIGAPMCANDTTSPFSANSTSGKVPLSVQFTIVGGRGNYRLDFGDGQVVGPAICMEGASCPPSYTITHTYTVSGSFIVTLTKSSDGSQVGSVTVSVAGD